MSIAKTPSKVSLPELQNGIDTVLDYLIVRFPAIGADVWRKRMIEEKVHWHDGSLIFENTPYRAKQRVYYYREVESEVEIPFYESIVFQNEHLLVAYKPHFLPVTPGGKFVNQCLLARLRETTGIEKLQPLYRLDRMTAGLVLFSNNPQTLPIYSQLFEDHQIHKTYQAVALIDGLENIVGQSWDVKNRIEKVPNSFHMQIVSGLSNSHSMIRCLRQHDNKALFELNPVTGKTHQLRLHMQALGWPILNDKTYPTLEPETVDNYSRPLQLVAKSISFIDPVTYEPRLFNMETSNESSETELNYPIC